MTQEELDRFLATVHRTDLVGYLEPKGEESAVAALDRRLRWAARARTQTDSAEEASFLLRNQDALRQQVESLDTEMEEEWIEFADAGHEAPGPSVWVTRDQSSRTESLDMDEPEEVEAIPARAPTPPPAPAQDVQRASSTRPSQRAASPAPPPLLEPEPPLDSASRSSAPRRAPSGPPRRPAAIQRAPVFTPPSPDGTPAFAESRGSPDLAAERAATQGGATPRGATSASPRQPTPSPPISRLSGRHRSPQTTPASGGRMPPLSRSLSPSPARARGSLATPRPLPSRWSSAAPPPGRGTPASGLGTPLPGRGPSPAVRAHTEPVGGERASYGAPDGVQPRVPTPTPAGAFPAATPRGSSYADVHIRGDARFMRSNDHYGTAEVVYESEYDHRALGVPTPAPRTPNTANPRGTGEDILGSLRSSARKGTPAPTVLQRAGRKKGLNVPLILFFMFGGVILLAALGLTAYNVGLLDGMFPEEVVDEGPSNFQDLAKPLPIVDELATDGSGDAEIEDGAVEDGTADEATTEDGTDAGATEDGTADAQTGASAPAADPPKPRSSQGSTRPKGDAPKSDPPKTDGGTTAKSDPPKSDGGTTAKSDPPKTDGGTTAKTEPPKTDGDATADASDGGDATATPPVEEPPPPPKGAFDGNFRGSVGGTACLADLRQDGETVTGTITVAGQPFRVTGRFNEAKGSLFLRGATDESVVFRGDVTGTQVKGTARLGAGQIPQAFQMMK